ncbi:putative peptide modification system cyclase [Stenotrophomonas sp. VV52]|uniref:putative peptide modification system cyclase n=1 Tax=Stenotrophomonas sp. VV52 TaxID=2066958 RepID=UPI000C9DD8EF|nr:putative peptide modification system cyclase [Stenotrophomonas sp. VV52]
MDGDSAPSTQPPLLKALLFTDLCDSLGLVERLGDSLAAELFQQHDRLVLALQQHWHGQQIDRSDGVFMLFERPIDALGFALDYQRELLEIGKQRGIELSARAGLHVGEVLTWENSAEAVAAGAKPVEVEGLAKPMAARLMMLAWPGQILLSAVAETLTRRASSMLGERGDRLLWKAHGRWRFKSVPSVQEVFEAGELGITPMRMPRGNAKARRVLPVWRRPAALAAQVALVGLLGIGTWLLLRPEPAIAFAERDWVVLADVDNASGEALFDDSLQRALLMSLEQSRYVNVLSGSKVTESRDLLRVPSTRALDRDLAIDVASREGARMVLAPAIRESAGHYLVSVDLLDPASRAVVRSYRAKAEGSADVIAAVDDVVGQLRAGLGESVASVQQSVPLPQATTANLQALKSFALAESAMGRRRFSEATKLFEAAIDADPDFAMAHVGLARLLVRLDQRAEAQPHLARAMAVSQRLPHRERLYLKAWSNELSPVSWPLDDWRVLADVYPDSYAGLYTTSWYLLLDNRFDDAERYARAATVPSNTLRAFSYANLGWIQLGTNRYDEAVRSFKQSEQLTRRGPVDPRADVLIAMRRYKEAGEVLARLGKPDDELPALMNVRVRLLLAADQDDCTGMREALSTEPMPTVSQDFRVHRELLETVVDTACQEGDADALARIAADMRPQLADPNDPGMPDRMLRLLSLVYLAQRQGDHALADRLLAEYDPLLVKQKSPVIGKWRTVVQAMQKMGQGTPAQGVALLKPLMDGNEPVQARVVLREAYRQLGDVPEFHKQNEWLFENRGRAIAEVANTQLMQALNVHDMVSDATLRQ